MTVESSQPREPRALRVSDADRERVAEELREAVAEGRLDMDEFEERLEQAYRARVHADLAPLTGDLPLRGDSAVARRKDGGPVTDWRSRIGGRRTSSGAVGFLGGFRRTGRWTVGRRFRALAFWGGGQIDLRDADFESRETVVRCFAIMGGMQVIVPPGVDVVSRGFALMGGFGTPVRSTVDPSAPRVIVTGFTFWGGVGIARRAPQELPADPRTQQPTLEA
ncbi:DUF1707 SHOCT-like domain-containing protein [Streptomyces sp. NBC_00328]|uniref:DUF1707 SHOCT-like domain-containing protein n=1 Tax=Streptomyces sp. NBC_00328 TaxID=2903646 RepID=UPI002E2D9B12|nr:DUF1707 domain-containing protein [Streptomyces sp. NBC_00328]